MGEVTESVFDGKSTIIPMANVQHVEKRYSKDGDLQLWIITDKTKWDFENDDWANPIFINNYKATNNRKESKEATKFLKAWCQYLFEVEGAENTFKQP
jgi:hypothetical protein